MLEIKIPKCYGYFFDIVRAMKAGEKLPVDEINIVGGRVSAKTTTVELSEAMVALAEIPHVGFVSLRNMQKDVKQLMEDYVNTFEAYEIPYRTNFTKNKLYIKNQEYRFLGMNGGNVANIAKNSGHAKFGNVKYIVIFFEERFEFSEKDVRAAIEAIRSIDPDNKDVQKLIINVCNPWALNSDYIQYCSKYQTWDINKLKTEGSQISVVDIPLPNGMTKRALFHYNNWRVAKDFLPESTIKSILETWNFDRKRAATVDYGMPGYETGAIYTHLLNNIGKAIYQEHEYLYGGMDYGWGNGNNSGKTVAYFLGYTSNNGIDIYGEYVHANYIHKKAPDVVAMEVVEFFYRQMNEYMSRIGWVGTARNLRVYVDNMAVGVIELLNSAAKKRGILWLRFVQSVKTPIQDRIEITLSAMYKHQLRFNENVKLLKSEMEMSYYEETKSGTQKRAKVNDHGLNAFEYAIAPIMRKIARENGLTKLAVKHGDNKWY